ncbi:S41 family peptidase [Desulfolithobacter sp.]
MKKYCTLLLTLVFFTFPVPHSLAGEQVQNDQETYKSLETFSNVLMLLQQHYVDKVDIQQVIVGAINGMLSSLDPHSSYLEPEDFKELQVETKGSFTGIGIEITIRDSVLTVVSPIEGTPAYREGIRAGDQIIRIDGKLTKNMTLMDAVKKLRGPKGSKVTLSIFRSGWSELKDFTLVRAEIPLHSVKSMILEPGFVYIRITNFQASTTRDFRKALRDAARKGEIRGLVLDLRNNPGGLLDQAVKVADVFIDKGVIVSTRGRDPEQDMVFEAHRDGASFQFPIIVLVNEGSASASEIVAAALQDHRRAIILGTETFGKGSVQTVIPMPDGAGLRLTTARYYTPSGNSIQARGITPDVEIAFSPPVENEDPNKRKNFWTVREKDLPHHFKNGEEDRKKEMSREDNELRKAREKLQKDNQLRTALIILKSLQIAAENKNLIN